MRVVCFLHEAVRLDADPAAAGMLLRDREIRLDASGDAVLDLDGEEIGARDALIAVDGDLLRAHPSPALARFAASRSFVFATSTTKRMCRPRAISSSGSRAVTSKIT